MRLSRRSTPGKRLDPIADPTPTTSGLWRSLTTVADVEFEGLRVELPVSRPASHDFRDVVSPRVGAEVGFEIGEVLRLDARAGFFYEPTPVVESDLFLDADRLGGGVGLGVSSLGSLWVLPRPISLDLHLLALGLLRRTYASAGAAAARPDLTISGFLISGGATLTLRF